MSSTLVDIFLSEPQACMFKRYYRSRFSRQGSPVFFSYSDTSYSAIETLLVPDEQRKPSSLLPQRLDSSTICTLLRLQKTELTRTRIRCDVVFDRYSIIRLLKTHLSQSETYTETIATRALPHQNPREQCSYLYRTVLRYSVRQYCILVVHTGTRTVRYIFFDTTVRYRTVPYMRVPAPCHSFDQLFYSYSYCKYIIYVQSVRKIAYLYRIVL